MVTEAPTSPPDPTLSVPSLPDSSTARLRPGSRRVTRTGTVLFFVGLLLVTVGYILDAYLYYLFVVTPPFSLSELSQQQLYAAVGATFSLAGILLAGVGWILDQDAIARATTESGTFVRGALWTAGVVIVCSGLVCVGAESGFTAYLSYAEYLQVSINLGMYTEVLFEVVLALGILLVALGWFLQHTARLRRIESRPR